MRSNEASAGGGRVASVEGDRVVGRARVVVGDVTAEGDRVQRLNGRRGGVKVDRDGECSAGQQEDTAEKVDGRHFAN